MTQSKMTVTSNVHYFTGSCDIQASTTDVIRIIRAYLKYKVNTTSTEPSLQV